MKQLQSPNLLRTSVFSVLLAAVMSVSACSSEKEDTNDQSGDATGVNQSGEADTSSQSGAPLPENDSNVGAGEGSGSAAVTSANDGMNTEDSSGSTDTSGNSMTDNNTNNDTSENPNLDQTSADGVQ